MDVVLCVRIVCVWIVYVCASGECGVRSVEGGCGVVRVFGLCGVCAFNFVGLILWDLFCESLLGFCGRICGRKGLLW